MQALKALLRKYLFAIHAIIYSEVMNLSDMRRIKTALKLVAARPKYSTPITPSHKGLGRGVACAELHSITIFACM